MVFKRAKLFCSLNIIFCYALLVTQSLPASALAQSYQEQSVRTLELTNSLTIGQISKKIGVYLETIQKNPLPPFTEVPSLFKHAIDAIIKNIQFQMQTNPSLKDPYLVALYEQLYMQLKNSALDGPGGRYAFTPALRALTKSKEFYDTLGLEEKSKVELTVLGDFTSLEKESTEIEESDRIFVQELIRDPVKHYESFSKRLSTEGHNAPFPEFANLIRYMEIQLSTREILGLVRENSKLTLLREIVLKKLSQAKKNGYPYLETINAIEDALANLDILQRGASDSRLPALYHSRVWQHYASTVKAQAPFFVAIPTISEIGFEDFLRIRAVPIGLVGVVVQPAYADGHFQSPLEFWFHDFNHSRRMWQEQLTRAKELGLSPNEYQKLSHRFVTKEILPLVEAHPEDSLEQLDLKRLMAVILFEIFHEEALPLDRMLVRETLARPALAEARFVYEGLNEDMTQVSYSLRSTATILAFTFRKIEGDFYDMLGMRLGKIASDQSRTRAAVAKAAQLLNEKLNLGINLSVILENVSDDSGIRGPFKEGLEKLAEMHPGRVEPFSQKENSIIAKKKLENSQCEQLLLRQN